MAGARCGPAALAVFSCTGRGQAVFKGPGIGHEAEGDCEARVRAISCLSRVLWVCGSGPSDFSWMWL